MEAFLKHLARLHRTHLAADVGGMRRGGRKSNDTPVTEDRLGHGDVVQVPRGNPGRIRDQNVAGPQVAKADVLDEGLDRHRQGADERGDAFRVLRQ